MEKLEMEKQEETVSRARCMPSLVATGLLAEAGAMSEQVEEDIAELQYS